MFEAILLANRGAERPAAASHTVPARAGRAISPRGTHV
jgi:hypothetical protein